HQNECHLCNSHRDTRLTCKRGPRAEFTPTEWVKFDKTGFEYKVHCHSPGLPFYDAERKCLKVGADLVSIHGKEENDFVANISGSLIKEHAVWIGLTKYDSWNWTDGTMMDYQNFYLE
ncbi:lectin C-type domain protein, partial [Ancylostoma duodenale]